MIKDLIISLIFDLIIFFRENKNFFDLSEPERDELLNNSKIPVSIKEYLEEVNEEYFMDDLYDTASFLKGEYIKNFGNLKLLKSIMVFLVEYLSDILDFSKEELKNIEHKTHFEKTLSYIIQIYSYQEISDDLYDIISNFGAPYILVQLSTNIDTETKIQLRDELVNKFKFCFPVFKVNKELLGGIRIFINGKTLDYSWRSQVNNIFSNLLKV